MRQRTKDTWGLWRRRELNPESNVQFGEGGAGTFSDGKLYSQVRDRRHLGRKVLEEFVAAGAPPEILMVSKPHIGTFKLVKMVESIRAKILSLGGEIRFEQKVTQIHREPLESETVDPRMTLAAENPRPNHGRDPGQRRDPAQPPRRLGCRA